MPPLAPAGSAMVAVGAGVERSALAGPQQTTSAGAQRNAFRCWKNAWRPEAGARQQQTEANNAR
jgi:hypothetical protein